jgi:UDP-2,3-diacylglucosamine pyrophosphatase LpxH
VWSRDRVALYVVSDLHLDERAEARLFSDERQGRQLSSLCERVARDEGSELIVLGDAFDFTAMQPSPSRIGCGNIPAGHAIEVLKGKRDLPHGAPLPDVAVLGHTHVLDWAVERGRLYVNLGTWTERAFDASSPRDASLPLLHVDASHGHLRVSLSDLSAADLELQRYEA